MYFKKVRAVILSTAFFCCWAGLSISSDLLLNGVIKDQTASEWWFWNRKRLLQEKGQLRLSRQF